MGRFKKIVHFSGIVFSTLLLSVSLFNCASVPKLSEENKNTIDQVLDASLPDMVKGETGYAISQGHNISFEKISPNSPAKGTVLLIMGNGQDALSWPPNFIDNFVDRGYQVIRYDHRETGLSTSEEKWDSKNPYTLDDMAGDALAILDILDIDKSHIVGVSMGGMIAQILAFKHPERTASLTIMMSSGNPLDSELSPMSDEILPKMISAVLKYGFFGSKRGQIKRQIVQKKILMGEATGKIDVKTMAETSLYNLKQREGYNLIAARHHYRAILASESRLESLALLHTPTLIIHGKKDPVMPIAHGKKLVATIPKADSLWIDNMGHDLPHWAIDRMTDSIISNFGKATE